MSISEYNGSAVVAMAGKECVAIGSDLRFGVKLQNMTTDQPKVGGPAGALPQYCWLHVYRAGAAVPQPLYCTALH